MPTLYFDPASVRSINSQRVMVAVPLLYMFLTHYLFQLLILIKGSREAIERLNDLGKRLCMFGIVSLFSLNFLQNSIMGSVLSWLILFAMIISHCFVFLKQTGQKYHNISLLIYYSLLMVWFGVNLFFYVYSAIS